MKIEIYFNFILIWFIFFTYFFYLVLDFFINIFLFKITYEIEICFNFFLIWFLKFVLFILHFF
jgi:hypothetical protein